jgi:hypothetical protein
VTHLVEHKKAVNRIAVAGNGAFFVTVSDDETTKVPTEAYYLLCDSRKNIQNGMLPEL